MLNRYTPKPLSQQTVVITDCNSRVGLVTARLAAHRGARVVLVGHDPESLDREVDAIKAHGGSAIQIVADVSESSELRRVRSEAENAFGNIDTWINNASIYFERELSKGELEEERRLFEVNFWMARIGSDVAVAAMAANGGVIINMGSEVASSGMPFLGIYQASKQALKAFTDCLRNEVRSRKLPIEVCLLRPAGGESPQEVAEAILRCAEHPGRDVYLGGPARLSAILETFFPAVSDMMAEARSFEVRKQRKRNYFNKLKINQPRKNT